MAVFDFMSSDLNRHFISPTYKTEAGIPAQDKKVASSR